MMHSQKQCTQKSFRHAEWSKLSQQFGSYPLTSLSCCNISGSLVNLSSRRRADSFISVVPSKTALMTIGSSFLVLRQSGLHWAK